MTASPPGHDVDPSTPSTARGRGSIVPIVIAAIVFAMAAIGGAYLDWIWWPVAYGGGLLIALAAGALLVVGGIVMLIGRGILRRVALVVLAVGLGLVAGQNLGPSREPLIYQFGGTLTLRLESPVVGVATGPVDCTNVASATEFAVSGDPNLRLDTAASPFVSIYVNVGDRWRVLSDAPRKDGVRLNIGITGALVTDAGKPSTVGMQATESSTLQSTFSNKGGSIRFGHLAAQTGPDFSGDSMDLAGTLEWTCGPVSP